MPLLQTLKCELNGHRFAAWQSPGQKTVRRFEAANAARNRNRAFSTPGVTGSTSLRRTVSKSARAPAMVRRSGRCATLGVSTTALGDETHLAVCGHCRLEEVQPHRTGNRASGSSMIGSATFATIRAGNAAT